MGNKIAKREPAVVEGSRATGQEASLETKPVISASTDPTSYVEQIVCTVDDIKENEMKEFPIGYDGGKVLLVKQWGRISALGTKCTHYGAPLVKSALGDGRLRCQWHGACFNIRNGDIEDFPGLDSLPCYEVKVDNGQVTVRADTQQLKTNRRLPRKYGRQLENKSTFVVVGGGPAGANCVESLRDFGYTGRLIFVVGEPYLPYDRIKLSKSLNIDADNITLRKASFYEERDVEIMLNTRLESLNPQEKTLTLSDDSVIQYDKVFLATGSRARFFKSKGSDLKNIFTLRTIDDANDIGRNINPNTNVVILGSSFIGLELAAQLANKVQSIYVIGRERLPFKASLGEVVGARVQAMFEEQSVKFQLERSIQEYVGNTVVEGVVLDNGTTLSAEVVIQGVGTIPNTEFLTNTGIELQKNGTVPVNDFLETGLDGVYAGGDIAYAPVLEWLAAIGHWGLANYHGHIAAQNMIGRQIKLNTVPFFWTVLFGKAFRYCGYAPNFDSTEVRGDVEKLNMVIFYVIKGKVAAVLTVNRDPIAAAFGELLHKGKELAVSDIDEWLRTFSL